MVNFSIAELSLVSDRFQKRIYIPLPGPEARRRMFELHVGDTPCEMSPKDYRLLADKTDGYVASKYCYLSAYMLKRHVVTLDPISLLLYKTHSCNLCGKSSQQHTLSTLRTSRSGPHALQEIQMLRRSHGRISRATSCKNQGYVWLIS